jgi:hypothetical protein
MGGGDATATRARTPFLTPRPSGSVPIATALLAVASASFSPSGPASATSEHVIVCTRQCIGITCTTLVAMLVHMEFMHQAFTLHVVLALISELTFAPGVTPVIYASQ